jgi:hypothetical protein
METIAFRYDVGWSADPDELSQHLANLRALRAGLNSLGIPTNVVPADTAPRLSLQARLPVEKLGGVVALFRSLKVPNRDLWLTCSDSETIAATAKLLHWKDDETGYGALALVPGL